MASPVGHVLAGYAISHLARGEEKRKLLFPIGLCIFMAIAPDLDFIPGLFLDRPAMFHGELLHSLGIAVFLNLVAAVILQKFGLPFGQMFSLGFLAYTSHLVLDMLQPDGRVPYGIPLLWPISQAYFLSPFPIFPGVHHVGSSTASTAEFIRGVLSFHNLLTIGFEIVVLAPYAFLWPRMAGQKRLVETGG
jgi:membrane-bound metal-dependent hydrolase YbcI (DUF457 family)